MEKFMTSVLAIILMATSAFAQRDHDKEWKSKFIKNFALSVDPADMTTAEMVAQDLLKKSPTDKAAWMRDHTVIIDSIPMTYVELGAFVNGKMTFVPQDAVTMNMRFMRLETVFADPFYTGKLFPMYGFSGNSDANMYNPPLVLDFDLNGDLEYDSFTYNEATKKHSVVYGNPPVAQNTPGNVPSVSVPQGAVKLPDGTIMGPGYMITPQGVTLFQQTNGSYLTAAQMQGQQAPPAKVDSTKRTASYSVNVEQSGDPKLLASNGSFGQGGQSATVPSDANQVEFWNQDRMRADGTMVEYERGSETGGEWHKVKEEKPDVIEPMTLKPNQVLINKTTGDVLLQERKRESRKVRRLYDLEEDAPTEGSARAVEAMNGGGTVGWTPIGMTWGVGGWVGGGYGNCNNGTCGRRAMDGHGCNDRAFRPVMRGSSLGGL